MKPRRPRPRLGANTPASEATSLRFRREATGPDRIQIAIGIGLTLTDVVMIESGQAEAALTARYFAWLDHIEAWSDEVRELQTAAARPGERFNDV